MAEGELISMPFSGFKKIANEYFATGTTKTYTISQYSIGLIIVGNYGTANHTGMWIFTGLDNTIRFTQIINDSSGVTLSSTDATTIRAVLPNYSNITLIMVQ